MWRLVRCYGYIVTGPPLSNHLSHCVSAHTWPRTQTVTHLSKYQAQCCFSDQTGNDQVTPHRHISYLLRFNLLIRFTKE